MFAGDFLLFALPGSLIILTIVYFVVRKLKLMPDGMSFDWLVVPTIGLAAGGLMVGFTLEDLVIWPSQLQNEVADRQFVSPLSLRGFSIIGIPDMLVNWSYEIDPVTAAQLARTCRRDPNLRIRWCEVAGKYEEGPLAGDGRTVSVRLEGTTVTIEESVF